MIKFSFNDSLFWITTSDTCITIIYTDLYCTGYKGIIDYDAFNLFLKDLGIVAQIPFINSLFFNALLSDNISFSDTDLVFRVLLFFAEGFFEYFVSLTSIPGDVLCSIHKNLVKTLLNTSSVNQPLIHQSPPQHDIITPQPDIPIIKYTVRTNMRKLPQLHNKQDVLSFKI